MQQNFISGVVVEQERDLSLNELSQVCSVSREYILELVDAGILEPLEFDSENWSFDGISLRRVKVSLRLQRDLEVNLPGIAVILDLLESREMF